MIAALLLVALSSFSHHHAAAITLGDDVCLTGYIMDNYCIYDNGGFLLDNRDVVTLQHPERHSFHCLADVDVCAASGFQVLGAKDPATDRHCPGFRLAETAVVLASVRATGRRGYCATCAGATDGAPERGFRATVRGTVTALGDGTSGAGGAPLLSQVELLDEGVGCAGAPTVPPLCARSTEAAPPEPEPPTPVIEEGDLKVGDDVCITNYVMDRFCIDLGHFLDDADHAPLENPELHSFHCLLDVARCRESGYLVLTDKHPETGAHCLGYRLDDTGVVVEAGQRAGRAGYCTDCTGDDAKPERGFRATVTGTVKELGDGTNGVTGTPVLENVTVVDESVGCATTRVEPVCLGAAPAPSPGLDPGPPTPVTEDGDLDAGVSNGAVWLAHGGVAFLAWGVLVII